jgi:DNA-binding PadR family transcriptional regulator
MRRDQDLYNGLIRLHILHHASEKPIFGFWIITELQRHGYRLSPGTIYPLLQGLVRKGYLKLVRDASGDGRGRRLYAITARGQRALESAKSRVLELFGELFERANGTKRSRDQRRLGLPRALRTARGGGRKK